MGYVMEINNLETGYK